MIIKWLNKVEAGLTNEIYFPLNCPLKHKLPSKYKPISISRIEEKILSLKILKSLVKNTTPQYIFYMSYESSKKQFKKLGEY